MKSDPNEPELLRQSTRSLLARANGNWKKGDKNSEGKDHTL